MPITARRYDSCFGGGGVRAQKAHSKRRRRLPSTPLTTPAIRLSMPDALQVDRSPNGDAGSPSLWGSSPPSPPPPLQHISVTTYIGSGGPQDPSASIIPPMKRRLITLTTAGNLRISPLAPQQLQQRRPHPVRRSDAGGPTDAPNVINLAHEDAAPTPPQTPGPYLSGAASPAYDPSPGQPQETAAADTAEDVAMPQVEPDVQPSTPENAPRRLFLQPIGASQGQLSFPPDNATLATGADAAAICAVTNAIPALPEHGNLEQMHETFKELNGPPPPPLQQHPLRTQTLLAVAAAAAAAAAAQEEGGAAEALAEVELRDAALRSLRRETSGLVTSDQDYDPQEGDGEGALQQLQQQLLYEHGEAAPGTGVADAELGYMAVSVTIAVRASSNRGRRQLADSGAEAVCRKGYVKGPVCGVFDLVRYLEGRDCILYQGRWVSRSKFEKAGGSTMAKWYRSIRALPSLEPLGEWLERHNLPVFRGPNRRSRKRSGDDSGDELGLWQWQLPAQGHDLPLDAAALLSLDSNLPLTGLAAVAGPGGDDFATTSAAAALSRDEGLPSGMLQMLPQTAAAAAPPAACGAHRDVEMHGSCKEEAAAGGGNYAIACPPLEPQMVELGEAPTDSVTRAQHTSRASAFLALAADGGAVAPVQQPPTRPIPHMQPLQPHPQPLSQRAVVGPPVQPSTPTEEGHRNSSPCTDTHRQTGGVGVAGVTTSPPQCRLLSMPGDGTAAATWDRPCADVVEVHDDSNDDDDDVILVDEVEVGVRDRQYGGGRAHTVADHDDLPVITCVRPRLPAGEAFPQMLAKGDQWRGGRILQTNTEPQRQGQVQQQQDSKPRTQAQLQQGVLQPIQQLQPQQGGLQGAVRQPRLLLRKAITVCDVSPDGSPNRTEPYFLTVSAPPDMLYCPRNSTGPAISAAFTPDGAAEGITPNELARDDCVGGGAAGATASGVVRRTLPLPHTQRRQALSAISCENLTRRALLSAQSLHALQQQTQQQTARSALGGSAFMPWSSDAPQRRNAAMIAPKPI
uniref:RlsA n=1 Tax=Platydorina caudata TaxID=51709 RepID=A0A1W5J3R3_9CHLO|nr:rlsA [Platydorina caudata]